MNPITKSAFAELAKFSRQYLNELIRDDKIILNTVVLNGKEMIDLDGPETQSYLKSRNRNAYSPKKQKQEKPKKNLKKTTKQKPQTTTKKSSNNNQEGYNGTTGNEEKRDLQNKKLIEDIEKVRIDNEKKRGALIPKILIQRVFSRLYSIDENQFKSLGINVSPKISSVYNSENNKKTREILTLLEKEKDAGLKKEINKILNAGESQRILEMNRILEDATGGILVAVKRELDKFLKNIEKLKE
jgi:hypothetical protein